MNRRRYRDGQDLAHNVIVDRVKTAMMMELSALTRAQLEETAPTRYTACVLPTRYGKSDLIRCVAIDLFLSGTICAALVLSPNRLLRDQLVDDATFHAMIDRYQIARASTLKYRALEGQADLINPTANGEFFLSATIQLIVENIGNYEALAESLLYRHGVPLLLIIDECHTGSEKNKWGEAIRRLVNKGACACLLTATPMRADGARIPGFDFEEVSAKSIKRYKTRDTELGPEFIAVDVYEGCSRLLKLNAHHTTTFRQAWAERPSPLCRISRLPFDCKLEDTNDQSVRMLSELSPTEVRQHLGRIVKRPDVARAGASRLVGQLQIARSRQSDVAGIVFVGNDDDPVRNLNEHANTVRAAIERIDPNLDVVIATSSDGNDGTEKIQKFAKGRGDVLIVKQMASLGLSVPRLKVGLDLSSIRTPAAYIQRVMRIATPYPPAEVCVLIVPEDCLSRALFETLISDEGGEARADDLHLVDTYVKPRETKDDRSLFTITEISEADFDDSQGTRAAAALRPDVDTIVSALPELLSVLSHAQIAKSIEKSGIVIGQRMERAVNTGAVADDLRADIHRYAKDVTNRRMDGRAYSSALYGEMCRQVYMDAFADAGIPWQPLEAIADIDVLTRLRVAFERAARVGEEA